jgi:hypothetical protein
MTHRPNGNDNGNLTETELSRRLGELPKGIEPRNDPWPRILRRITAEDVKRPRAGTSWLKVAAAVVLAFAVGVFFGQSRQELAPGSVTVAQTAQQHGQANTVPNLGGALAGAERVYQAAFSEYVDLGNANQMLEPATLDAIERDWQEMLDAESALSLALEQYPNNPWLNKRMLELRARQLEMLKQLAGLDRASRRTEI